MCAAGGQSEEGVQGPWLSTLRPGGEGTRAKQGLLPSCPEKEAGERITGSQPAGVCVSGNIPSWQGTGCLMPPGAERSAPCTQLSLSAMPTPGRRSAAIPSLSRAQGPTRQAPPSLRLIVTVLICLCSDRRKEIWVLVWQNPRASTQQPSALINPGRNVGQDALHIIS